MDKLPLPFPPNEEKLGISWLYTCVPQVYSVSTEGYAQGFSVSTVAYILSSQGAKHLINFVEVIKQKYGSNNYSSWDSQIDAWLKSKKLNNYIPFRCYGEHGGKPNLEHKNNGLSLKHRADILYRRLAFMPDYAINAKCPFFVLIRERVYGRTKGIARLLLGKFIRLPVLKKSSVPWHIIRLSFSKYL